MARWSIVHNDQPAPVDAGAPAAPPERPRGHGARTLDSSPPATTIHAMRWASSGRGARVELTIDEAAAELRDTSDLLWIDLLNPSVRTLTALADQLGVHEGEVEDVLAPLERPKAFQHREHASFVTYALTPRADVAHAIDAVEEAERTLAGAPEEGVAAERYQDPLHDASVGAGGHRDAEPDAVDAVLEGTTGGGSFGDSLFRHTRVSGFVFAGGLITVRSDERFRMEAVERRWQEIDGLADLGPYALVQGILDEIVDGYFAAVQFLDEAIEGLEDDLFLPDGRLQGFQRRAYALRKELVALRRVVLPMREVLHMLWRRTPGSDHRLDALYADLTDHVLRVAEWTESLRDMVGTVFETHLSLQDQRLNEVMKKLAGWAAIISIPTLVTGWFGMNVPYLGQDHVLGLVLACVFVIVPPAILWFALRRGGWL